MSNNRSKNVTRNTTCSNLFDLNELEFCYDICKPRVDILSCSKKLEKSSNKEKYASNKCRQP